MAIFHFLNEMAPFVLGSKVEHFDIDGLGKKYSEIPSFDPAHFASNAAIAVFNDVNTIKGLQEAAGFASHAVFGQVGYDCRISVALLCLNFNGHEPPETLLAFGCRVLLVRTVVGQVPHILVNGQRFYKLIQAALAP